MSTGSPAAVAENVKAYDALIALNVKLGARLRPPYFAKGVEPKVGYMRDVRLKNLDVEMGFPVTKVLAGSGPIQAGRLPECKVAVCMFTGPYQEMAPAYDELTAFVQAQGYEPSGITYEYYLYCILFSSK